MNYKILKADISKSKLEELLGALEGGDCIKITYAPASKTQVLQMCITPAQSVRDCSKSLRDLANVRVATKSNPSKNPAAVAI
jgi:hypothetical protein